MPIDGDGAVAAADDGGSDAIDGAKTHQRPIEQWNYQQCQNGYHGQTTLSCGCY
jgi:hypothetical protein